MLGLVANYSGATAPESHGLPITGAKKCQHCSEIERRCQWRGGGLSLELRFQAVCSGFRGYGKL